MQIIKAMVSTVMATALTIVAMVATAQTKPADEWDCKQAKSAPKQRTTIFGRNIIMFAPKFPTAVDCPRGVCSMKVEVKSYTNDAGGDACCVRAEYAAFNVPRSSRSATLQWDLVPMDKYSYIFNSGNGVFIVDPPTQPNDFGQPVIDPLAAQWYQLPSRNGRFQSFNYGFTIFRDYGNGRFLACDPNDPVIVNQGQ